MELGVFVNGKEFKQFTSVETYASVLDVAHKMTLTYREGVTFNGQQFDIIGVNDKVEVYIDNQITFTGYLAPDEGGGGKSENIDINDKEHRITVSLQDMFGFLETNKLSKSVNHNTPVDIVRVLSDVLEECNYDKSVLQLKIQKDINGKEIDTRITSNDKMSEKVGTKAFQYLSKFLQKKQLLLYSNGVDTLNLSKSGIEVIEGANIVFNKYGDRINNAMSMERLTGNHRAYGTFEVICQNDIKALRGKKPSQIPASHKYTVNLPNGLPFTKNVVILQSPADRKILEAVALMMAGNRKRKETVVLCRLPGFYANKENKIQFEVNKLIAVESDYLNINDYMLIQDVRHFYSPENKTNETLLTLIDKSGIDVSNIQEITIL